MLTLPGFIIGALVGWLRASRRKGSFADKLQWAAVHGIVCFLIALLVTIIAVRSGWM